MLRKNVSPTSTDEILSVTIQNYLQIVFSAGMEYKHIEQIFACFDYLKKTRRTINPQFENFVGLSLCNFADIFYNGGNIEYCLNYLERSEDFKLNLPKDFYLFKAKVYREAGKKDFALTAYKKALEVG